MKNRIFALLLVFSLIFTLAACGGNPDDETGDSLHVEYEGSTTDASPTNNPTDGTDKMNDPTDYSIGKPTGSTQKPTAPPTAAQTVKITVPENFTLAKIAKRLEANGVCSEADFIKAAQKYPLSSSPVLADAAKVKNLCFPFEGYLFPATYEFQKGTDPKAVLDKMVATANAKLGSSVKARAKELGYSVHEILTIASIIEKEAFTADQRTKVSAVLHNRLKKGMKLQCDVTTKYCTGVIAEYYPEKLESLKYVYNTYRCAALPAGPICNPGMASINAALYPDDAKYLFFVITNEGSAFAETYEEHLENLKKFGV